ncbi:MULTISPECIES: TetR family transcriptional regulator [unclassified Mycolicibacterium]|uniref:TetR family transcriptional regulator n=1 Tax=unclassified Mycolicibacterium TaxID=2636767 RepID=UPI002EDB7235
MSSPTVATVTRLHDAHGRRAHTCRRIFGAAAQLLDSDADVSVTRLAAQAKIAPATLRAHFPSLEVVFAELYLHRVTTLPLDVDPDVGIAARVSDQLRAMTLLLADEPRLARMCTQVLVSAEDDTVADVRSRISIEVRRRISTALGTGAWPEVLTTLESVFWGALLQAQTGAMTYRQAARRLEVMVALIVPQA